MAENSRDSGSSIGSGRGFLRGLEHEAGMARGSGSQSILIPLGHFALILVALFVVSNAADKAAESKATATSAISRADTAEREARIAESKIESLRNEVSELRGMILGKPKEK